MIHPTPWRVYRFGYERYAVLDANQAEVAEFVSYSDATLCVDAINKPPATLARGVFYGAAAVILFQAVCIVIARLVQ